jgi:hypothetical protein
MVSTSPVADTDVISGVAGAASGAGQSEELGPELVQAIVDALGLGLGVAAGVGLGVPVVLVAPQAETIATAATRASRHIP